MAAPKYNSSNYDSAAAKYSELQDKYTGENGWNSARSQAKESAQEVAEQAGGVAGANAQAAARSAGMSRSKSIATGAQMSGNASANAYGNAYNSSLNSALANNQNAVNSQAALMQMQQQKDTNNYNSESNRYGAAMGAVGGVFNGVASALSDENEKEITERTSSDRCDELLAKLRGEN